MTTRVVTNNCRNLLIHEITKLLKSGNSDSAILSWPSSIRWIPISVCLCLVKVACVPFCTHPLSCMVHFGLRAPQGPWRMCHFTKSCSTGFSWACCNSARVTSSISFGWIGVFNQNNACTCGRSPFCRSTVNMCEHDLRKTFIRHHTTENFWERNSNLPHRANVLKWFAVGMARPTTCIYKMSLWFQNGTVLWIYCQASTRTEAQ